MFLLGGRKPENPWTHSDISNTIQTITRTVYPGAMEQQSSPLCKRQSGSPDLLNNNHWRTPRKYSHVPSPPWMNVKSKWSKTGGYEISTLCRISRSGFLGSGFPHQDPPHTHPRLIVYWETQERRVFSGQTDYICSFVFFIQRQTIWTKKTEKQNAPNCFSQKVSLLVGYFTAMLCLYHNLLVLNHESFDVKHNNNNNDKGFFM